jgi:hypothetical protein
MMPWGAAVTIVLPRGPLIGLFIETPHISDLVSYTDIRAGHSAAYETAEVRPRKHD